MHLESLTVQQPFQLKRNPSNAYIPAMLIHNQKHLKVRFPHFLILDQPFFCFQWSSRRINLTRSITNRSSCQTTHSTVATRSNTKPPVSNPNLGIWPGSVASLTIPTTLIRKASCTSAHGRLAGEHTIIVAWCNRRAKCDSGSNGSPCQNPLEFHQTFWIRSGSER